jgi:hypothetical protein
MNHDKLHQTLPYSTILSLIGTGKENAIHLQELISYTGLKNREVRKCIEFIRRSGIVILSGDFGYYFPSTSAELQEYIAQEQHRANSIHLTLQTAKRAYDNWNQTEIKTNGDVENVVY